MILNNLTDHNHKLDEERKEGRKKKEREKIADYRLLFSTQQLNIVKSMKSFSTTITLSILLVRHVMSHLVHEQASHSGEGGAAQAVRRRTRKVWRTMPPIARLLPGLQICN